VRKKAADALGKIGAPAFEPLMAALKVRLVGPGRLLVLVL
jgi:hypothetical protein